MLQIPRQRLYHTAASMPAPEIYRQALAFAKDWGGQRKAFYSRFLRSGRLKPQMAEDFFLTFAYTRTHRFVVKNLFQYSGAPFFSLDAAFMETFNHVMLPIITCKPVPPGRAQHLVFEEIRRLEKESVPNFTSSSGSLSFHLYLQNVFWPALVEFEKTVEFEQPPMHDAKFEHEVLWAAGRALQTTGSAFAALFIHWLERQDGPAGPGRPGPDAERI